MGFDLLFYRLAVIAISAVAATISSVVVAPVWWRIGSSRNEPAQGVPMHQSALRALTAEMVVNILFIICAYLFSDYSQRVFDRVWSVSLVLSVCFTLIAAANAFLRSNLGMRRFKAASVMLFLLNILGGVTFLMRY